MGKFANNGSANYDQLLGKKGVVYVLKNSALNKNIVKIGATQKNGADRARQLNQDATTGVPAEYVCVFQYDTLDCGKSEKLVHKHYDKSRRGKHGIKANGQKWGQEFFYIDNLESAKDTIIRICKQVDEETKAVAQQKIVHEKRMEQHAKEVAARRREEAEKALLTTAKIEYPKKITSTITKTVTPIKSVNSPQPDKKKEDSSWSGGIVGLAILVMFIYNQVTDEPTSSSTDNTSPPKAVSTTSTNWSVTEGHTPVTRIEPIPINQETSTNQIPMKPQNIDGIAHHSKVSRQNMAYKKNNNPTISEEFNPPTVTLPDNAHSHYDGHNWGWECNSNYIRISDACVKIEPQPHEMEVNNKSMPLAVSEGYTKENPGNQDQKRLDCPLGAQQVGDECVDYRRPFWRRSKGPGSD